MLQKMLCSTIIVTNCLSSIGKYQFDHSLFALLCQTDKAGVMKALRQLMEQSPTRKMITFNYLAGQLCSLGVPKFPTIN